MSKPAIVSRRFSTFYFFSEAPYGSEAVQKLAPAEAKISVPL